MLWFTIPLGSTTKTKANIVYANVSSVVRPKYKTAVNEAVISECIDVEPPSETEEMALEEISGEESETYVSDYDYLPSV